MANVQIRDVPPDVHRELKRRAAEAGVSLSEYLRGELERVAARPPLAEVFARADARAGGARIDDVVAAIRSGRDRR
jgi:plasmid stability protein